MVKAAQREMVETHKLLLGVDPSGVQRADDAYRSVGMTFWPAEEPVQIAIQPKWNRFCFVAAFFVLPLVLPVLSFLWMGTPMRLEPCSLQKLRGRSSAIKSQRSPCLQQQNLKSLSNSLQNSVRLVNKPDVWFYPPI